MTAVEQNKNERFREDLRQARAALTGIYKGLFGNGVGPVLEMLKKVASELPRRIERGGLAVQQFAGIYPLRIDPVADDRLNDALSATNKELAGFAKVRGLHSARIMFLDDQDPAPQTDAQIPAGPRGALLLGLVFDGWQTDVLATLLEENPALITLLSYCTGFPADGSTDQVMSFLRSGRLQGGYFFSDLEDYAQTEIKRAAQIRQAFNEFQAEHPRGPSQAEFREFWDSLGELRAPISWLEQRIDEEERWSRRALEFNQCSQERERRRIMREDPHGVTPRGVHVKHHGVLEAEFIVNPALPARFRKGVFEREQFKALIRLSNSQKRVRRDRAFDGRGMAIKLLDVAGERTFPPFPQGVPELDATENQDFVLFSHPTFFTKDIVDFTILQSALETGSAADTILRSFVYFARRRSAAGIFLRTIFRRIEHPFDISYHSATPYQLGADLAVKYSVVPVLARGDSFARSEPDHDDPNFLRKVLQESLLPARKATIELKFMIHVLDKQPPPVEDACADWDKLGAQAIHAATLRIESQDFSAPENMERAEHMTFNPWNGLAAHRPLGSLNRARLLIYQASAKGRGAELEDDIGPHKRPPPNGAAHVPTIEAGG